MRKYLWITGGAFSGAAFSADEPNAMAVGMVLAFVCFIWADWIGPQKQRKDEQPEAMIWDEKRGVWRRL